MKADQPATIPVAIAAVLSTGVALIGYVAGLDDTLKVLILAFGNSVIGLGTIIFLNARTTSSTAPVVQRGTEVAIEGSTDTVVVQPSPPGPVGIEDGADTGDDG